MNAPANDPLPEKLIDDAYDIMSTELDHWQVIGPQMQGRTEFYSAVRRLEQAGFAPIMLKEDQAAAQIEHKEFTTKAYAIAYIQWRSLKVVLETLREPLSKLS
jgi:hypothetical protein